MQPHIIAEITNSLPYFMPELILSAAFLIVLMAEIFSKRSSYTIMGILTLAGLFASMASAVQLYSLPPASVFFQMITVDHFAIFFKFVFGISTALIVLFSMNSDELKRYNSGEYYSLMLAVVLGMNLLASANNLLMIWLALELVSVPSYLLSGFLKDDRLSAEASLKFVIYGSVSTAVMLFGLSYLYGMTGAYELNQIREALSSANVNSGILLITVSLILVGIGYKIAAVPFHFWCPDVYQGSPVAITAFFSIGPKAAGFAMLIRFFYGALAEGAGDQYVVVGNFQWPTLIALIAAITMTVGNVVAIWQRSMKRMMAYSSIAHVGYMLMGFVLLNSEGIQSILFYILIYLVMNLGAFLVVIAVSSKMNSDNLSDYRGLMVRSPFAAAVLTIFMLSLTGIPALGGFIGKLYLFMAAWHAKFYWLVILAAVNSVISFAYYGGVVKRMILEDSPNKERIQIPRLSAILLTVLAILTFAMGLYWSPFAEFSRESASLLFKSAPIARK
jgi:NADH-quinone oxidoreductase subunit N